MSPRSHPSCFGDYCHYEGRFQGTITGDGDDSTVMEGNRRETCAGSQSQGAAACKKASYRSILKSRAEEKALSAWSSSHALSNIGMEVDGASGARSGGSKSLVILQGVDEIGGYYRKVRGGFNSRMPSEERGEVCLPNERMTPPANLGTYACVLTCRSRALQF